MSAIEVVIICALVSAIAFMVGFAINTLRVMRLQRDVEDLEIVNAVLRAKCAKGNARKERDDVVPG